MSQTQGGETAEQRLDWFAALQRHTFELLQSLPEGLAHFLKRNYRPGRSHYVGGTWLPVEPDRHPPVR